MKPHISGAFQAIKARWRERPMGLHGRLVVVEQLARLLRAGVSFESAIHRLLSCATDGRMREALIGLASKSGAHPCTTANRLFTPTEMALFLAGERTGNLPEILDRISSRLKTRLALRRRLLASASYPILLLLAAAFIIPIPTAFTKGVFAWLGEALATCAGMALVMISIWLAGMAIHITGMGDAFKAMAWRTPLCSAIYRRAVLSDALYILASSLGAGLPIHESLRLAGEASGDPIIKAAFRDISRTLAAGDEFAPAFARTRLLSGPSVVSLAGAEQAGSLSEALMALSEDLYAQLEHMLVIASRVASFVFLLIALGTVASRLLDAFSNIIPGSGTSIDQLEQELMREMPIRRIPGTLR